MSAFRATDVRLVGRAGEVDEVVRTVRSAGEGRAGALLVTGEAGVGKTSLVRAAVAESTEDLDVLWAQCLPLTSLAVPFLPLASALRDWSGDRSVPPPDLGGAAAAQGSALLVFDAWLAAASRRRPVVLVVDDLHWADQSTLDVLMYVLAGRAERRLAVLLTQRTDDAEAGPALTRWLADVRRLPVLQSLPLGRLDRPSTADQLAELLGRVPHQSLVDDVFARSRGNPYLTTLLAAGLDPDARHLAAGLPVQLREAARRSWGALSAQARDVTRLLAVAGRPSTTAELEPVARATGARPDLLPGLREAVDACVVEAVRGGAYWFVHPLLAETLEAGLLPDERRRLHTALAHVAEARLAAGDDGPSLVIDVADHHWSAGDDGAAFRWALAGADAAERGGGAAEALRLLARALDLLPKVDEPGVSRRDLLDRIRTTAERAGEQEDELRAIEDLLDEVDPASEPLVVAELLVRRASLRMATGREFYDLEPLRRAVELSAVEPTSATHAWAVAELADAEFWHGGPDGPRHAEEAVALARASGSPRALAYALTARAMARMDTDAAAGHADADEARRAAVTARDGFAYVHATLWAANSLDCFTTPTWLAYVERSREALEGLDLPFVYTAWLSIDEAGGRLLLGDWQRASALLRRAMGSSPGPMGDIHARLTSALLACWQGRPDEAEQHLARAEELNPHGSDAAVYPFAAVRTELAVRRGDTDVAVTAALAGLRRDGATATHCERLVPLAARALADEAGRRRDRGASAADVQARLADLHAEFPEPVPDGPSDQGLYAEQVAGMDAWYRAEQARCLDAPDAAAAWAAAAVAFERGGLRWDEAYATHRLAEALVPDRTAREEAAAALRRAYGLATDLAAVPILAEVEALARAARIPLGEPGPTPDTASTAALGDLTPREREVLTHLVAGRTYAEIARSLVISEKTVSVHVSNLLRKTGTANRVELAQLAHRLAVVPG